MLTQRGFVVVFSFLLVLSMMLLPSCGPDENTAAAIEKSLWRNHSDSAHYVGMNQCRSCHENIYQTFIETGMGKSFDSATITKSVARFGKDARFYDDHRNMWYESYFRDSAMYIHEFRIYGSDTLYNRVEKVDYIIGSGQHTNSHMYSVNGYLFQMPMTYYAQKGQWDLPPGFEGGYNSRFTRNIGLECMSCHNSLPDFVMGSENKFNSVPNGIGCERCHGPGSIHVAEKLSGNVVDTSKYIDYSIVNPGKLSPELQFDVCQRCHLQGNAVLKPGKSFFDFRPGMELNSVMTVFMPKYKGAEDQFIMASHAERLKMSQCFIQTESKREAKSDSLRPYKNALTCVTCHNPHVSVKATGDSTFNAACNSCHGTGKSKLSTCTESETMRSTVQNNCVTCHIPRTGSIDIPHVTVHDHRIAVHRKDSSVKPAEDIAVFLGLYAVNEKNPAREIIAKAYLQQFEKFNHDPVMLDSAIAYIDNKSAVDVRSNFSLLVHYYFLRGDNNSMIDLVNRESVKWLRDTLLIHRTFDNGDAWTAYRIGEAFFNTGNMQSAETYYSIATSLAPFHPDFRAKYALALASQQKLQSAIQEYGKVLEQYPLHMSSLTSLGYLWLSSGNSTQAEKLYTDALKNDPDDQTALMNTAGLYIFRKEYNEALVYVNKVLVVNPASLQANQLRGQLQTMIRTGN
jgi:tetratricopeptide (TPR) repeat protein